MTFEEILDQAIAMLQRRGRLTYRTLKRQFNLDDESLEDLKIELITGQQVAVDEHGAVVAWAGEAGAPAESTLPLLWKYGESKSMSKIAPMRHVEWEAPCSV